MSFFFQVDINNYLAGLVEVPTGVKTLADLITFNTEHADLELIPPYYTSQAQWVLSHETSSRIYCGTHRTFRFISSEETTVNASYFKALAADEDLGRTRGIDGALKKFNSDALLLPTYGCLFFHT